jgi:translation initiation factor IF-3
MVSPHNIMMEVKGRRQMNQTRGSSVMEEVERMRQPCTVVKQHISHNQQRNIDKIYIPTMLDLEADHL